jgi:hypothetical protein
MASWGLLRRFATKRRYKDVIGFWDVLFSSNAEGDFFENYCRCKVVLLGIFNSKVISVIRPLRNG